MVEIEHIEYTLYLDLLLYDLSAILFGVVFMLYILFVIKQKGKIEEETRPFLNSLIFYSLISFIGSICTHIFRRATNYGTKINVPNYEFLYILNLIGLILVLFGPIWLIYILEEKFFNKKVIKEKHLITIIQFILLIILIVVFSFFIYFFLYDPNSIEILELLGSLITNFWLVILGVQVSAFLGGFFYLSIKSSGKVRKYSLYISVPYFFRIVLNLIAERLRSRLEEGTLNELTNSFFIRLGVLNLLHITAAIILLYGFWRLYTLEDISDENKVLLTKFIKPRIITLEEITLYKEQKLCIVCKGKVRGFNIFLCSSCDVLYCRNCAKQLSDLENACWVCNTAFDISKPSTPFMREEESNITVKGMKDLELKNNKL